MKTSLRKGRNIELGNLLSVVHSPTSHQAQTGQSLGHVHWLEIVNENIYPSPASASPPPLTAPRSSLPGAGNSLSDPAHFLLTSSPSRSLSTVKFKDKGLREDCKYKYLPAVVFLSASAFSNKSIEKARCPLPAYSRQKHLGFQNFLEN